MKNGVTYIKKQHGLGENIGAYGLSFANESLLQGRLLLS